MKTIWHNLSKIIVALFYTDSNESCKSCNVEMDACAYDSGAGFFYYKCPKCKNESHHIY